MLPGGSAGSKTPQKRRVYSPERPRGLFRPFGSPPAKTFKLNNGSPSEKVSTISYNQIDEKLSNVLPEKMSRGVIKSPRRKVPKLSFGTRLENVFNERIVDENNNNDAHIYNYEDPQHKTSTENETGSNSTFVHKFSSNSCRNDSLNSLDMSYNSLDRSCNNYRNENCLFNRNHEEILRRNKNNTTGSFEPRAVTSSSARDLHCRQLESPFTDQTTSGRLMHAL